MEVDASPTPEDTEKAEDTDKDVSPPKKKKRKPSVDVETILSSAVSSLPELSPEDITDLLRRSSNNPGNIGKAVAKRCRNVKEYQQYFSENEKKSFAALKDITIPDMKEVKVLTDMQRVALRYHLHTLLNVETDYNLNGLGKYKLKKEKKGKDVKNGGEKVGVEVEKIAEKKQKQVQKPLKDFVGEHIKCPAIPKNQRRTIEMKMKRIDKKNPVKDLKKKLQEDLKQILSAAGKMKKDSLTESLKERKEWERESVYFTLRRLNKSLSSGQKYNKKELTYIRFHINATQQIIGFILNPKSKSSPVKKGKSPAKKTKVASAKKGKQTNKKAAKKAAIEKEESNSDEEMSADEKSKVFDDETQAQSEDSDDDNNE